MTFLYIDGAGPLKVESALGRASEDAIAQPQLQPQPHRAKPSQCWGCVAERHRASTAKEHSTRGSMMRMTHSWMTGGLRAIGDDLRRPQSVARRGTGWSVRSVHGGVVARS